jgi:hypothetical protein
VWRSREWPSAVGLKHGHGPRRIAAASSRNDAAPVSLPIFGTINPVVETKMWLLAASNKSQIADIQRVTRRTD